MAIFELVISLLLAGAVLSTWARRLKTPYPALLALAGAAIALLPNTPRVALDPQLALALFVAPVLLDYAFDSSPRDLKQNWRPLVSLALDAVVSTVAVVAVVARWLVPELPWASAVAQAADTSAMRRAHSAERRTLFDLRARGVIGDDAFHRIEEELDWAELNLEASRADRSADR